MNLKKIVKISTGLFIIGIVFSCLTLHYQYLYKKTSTEINMLKKDIIAKEFPKEKIKILYEIFLKDEINKRTNKLSQPEKEMEIGRQRVQSAISQNTYYASQEDIRYAKFKLSLFIDKKVESILKDEITQRNIYETTRLNLAILSAGIILTALSLFLFCIILHMKRRSEKANAEQRIGFLLSIISLLATIIPFIIYALIKNRNIYEYNMWLLVANMAILLTGIIMYFNIVSSVIKWVKFGDTRK